MRSIGGTNNVKLFRFMVAAFAGVKGKGVERQDMTILKRIAQEENV